MSACLIHSIFCAVGVVARNLLNFVSSRCTEFQRKSTLGVHGVDALNLFAVDALKFTEFCLQ